MENAGLNELSGYLNTPGMGPVAQSATNNATATLNGGFDPRTSDFYKALRDEALYNNQRAINDTRAGLGGQNRFFSSERIQKEGDINVQTSNYLNSAMAGLANQERDRQMQLIPQAGAIEALNLQKPQAALTLGAAPRLLAQDQLEKAYLDFKRQRDEKAGVVNTASAFRGTPMTQQNLGFQAFQPSNFERYLMPILQDAAQSFGSAATGGRRSAYPAGMVPGPSGWRAA